MGVSRRSCWWGTAARDRPAAGDCCAGEGSRCGCLHQGARLTLSVCGRWRQGAACRRSPTHRCPPIPPPRLPAHERPCSQMRTSLSPGPRAQRETAWLGAPSPATSASQTPSSTCLTQGALHGWGGCGATLGSAPGGVRPGCGGRASSTLGGAVAPRQHLRAASPIPRAAEESPVCRQECSTSMHAAATSFPCSIADLKASEEWKQYVALLDTTGGGSAGRGQRDNNSPCKVLPGCHGSAFYVFAQYTSPVICMRLYRLGCSPGRRGASAFGPSTATLNLRHLRILVFSLPCSPGGL